MHHLCIDNIFCRDVPRAACPKSTSLAKCIIEILVEVVVLFKLLQSFKRRVVLML